MCQAQIIISNDFGCVVHCNKLIHLGFGNLISVFETNAFNSFCNHICTLYETHYPEMLLTGHKLLLQTDSESIMIVLNTDELKSLYGLINEAIIILTVNKLLNEKCA